MTDKHMHNTLDFVEQASCLSDLLLRSPSQWMQSPMLSYRTPTGWKTFNRITIQQRVLRVAAWLESQGVQHRSLIPISEPTRLRRLSYAVFCLKQKKNKKKK